ncbi:long-chain-fatty-acid--CoA ligase [Phenylobacterium sp.]|uniref:long-chain-fatty-acid--CoA ligase n=1 Tax=Phenylobacterium sp. TaxID=1871053 RepID=UPI0027315062|nr:long-chain-fatty-acid--CoA ligase [Phenylobacterium sp.]MDP2214958.1 long-chain-fatty-acid--CoA ligase [Phenylobacterium sp.]
MLGLMQDWPLTVDKILDHAKEWHGDREIVSRSVEGPIVRTTYAEVHGRAKRLSNALLNLGMKPGDRIATLAWNTARHLEAWYGIMGVGMVCHTLNPRLFPEQLAYIINHAEDRVIFTDLTFLPILAALKDKLPTVEKIIVMTDEAHMADCPIEGALCFETLVAEASPDCAWGGFDENTAAGLCYTSGTTGNPKGVLYSHRSNFLHTLTTMGADVLGVGAADSILPVVPMFHANAWGIAFSAPAVGAKLVMPGPKLDGASVHELLESEQVNFSAAVPTVWQMLLQHLRDTGGKLTSLKRVVIGGSAVPEAIVRGFRDEYGVDVTHAWGMTETSPLGTQATPNHKIAAMSEEEQLRFKLKQGRPPLGIEMKLVDDDEKRLPHDGTTFGRLKVKGPFVVGEYFKADGGKILDGEGFFDTGDVATIDDHGYMQITDRAKDVIKSGGEWISSIEIENLAAGHPKAVLAAVIGVAHPKWDERPLLLVKLKDGESASKQEFLDFLEGKIAKWWMPDDVVFVDDIPLGATGKIDKKLIRDQMADYRLPTAEPAPAAPLLASSPKLYAPEPEAPQADASEGHASVWTPAPGPGEPRAESEGLTVVEGADGQGEPPATTSTGEAVAEALGPFPDEAVEATATSAAAWPAYTPEPELASAQGAQPTSADSPIFMPASRQGRRKSSPLAGLFMIIALLIALAPAAMWSAGTYGWSYGWVSGDVARALLAWFPQVAMASAFTGVMAIVVAAIGGFRRYWAPAFIAILISVVTLAVLAASGGLGV